MFGFLFLVGCYVTASITNNDLMKRTSLFLFGVMGLVAIPTYISGDASMAALSESRISKEMMNSHYIWGVVATVVLVITGAVAWFELWRSRSAGRLSDQTLNAVFGLSIITLVLMAVVGELGWEINHFELHLPPKVGAYMAPGTTPQTWSHVHMILNHFPTVGFVFALVFYLIALAMNNDVMKRAGLVVFVICGILAASTYVTGAARCGR
jgi:uncharacterized membrane protein